MFSDKQTQLMNTLGIVSDRDRSIMYEGFCESECEMRANGINPGTFTDYLEARVRAEAFKAKRNLNKVVV
jgi:hypothetical protein